jgi:IS605 OrfB family transposase
LKDFADRATTCSNWMLSERRPMESAASLQKRLLAEAKRRFGFNVQVACDLARGLAKTAGNRVRGTTVKFNVPRNCKTFRTKGFFFVELGLYPRHRTAVPIKRNRNFDRFVGHLGNGWSSKTFGLTPSLEVVAYLSKEEKTLTPRRNILGIDINVKNFAYTALTPGRQTLTQGYLGQHIWVRKRYFEERRALLQSLHAIKKLKRMRRRQRNCVKTNVGQMVREIVLLARKFDADVSIERLRRFRPKGRTFNRKVMTMPFYLFRRVLEGRCFDNDITLNRVDPYHTSKWCSRCGAVADKGHYQNNYALFRCDNCCLTMNADRKASLAVAVKTLLERRGFLDQKTLQISGRRVPVSGLLRVSDAPEPLAVPALAQGRGKPTGFGHG